MLCFVTKATPVHRKLCYVSKCNNVFSWLYRFNISLRGGHTHTHTHTHMHNSTLSFLRCNLYHCQRNVKIDVYYTYVRPILEYTVMAWAPHTQKNINKIKIIQHWAARFVMSNFSTYSSVTTMLSKLKWNTSHHRRHILKLTMLFKILHNLVELHLPS